MQLIESVVVLTHGDGSTNAAGGQHMRVDKVGVSRLRLKEDKRRGGHVTHSKEGNGETSSRLDTERDDDAGGGGDDRCYTLVDLRREELTDLTGEQQQQQAAEESPFLNGRLDLHHKDEQFARRFVDKVIEMSSHRMHSSDGRDMLLATDHNHDANKSIDYTRVQEESERKTLEMFEAVESRLHLCSSSASDDRVILVVFLLLLFHIQNKSMLKAPEEKRQLE